MIQITNISITEKALRILREKHARFRPRNERETFGMYFMVSYKNPDGSMMEGFRPGYSVDSVPATDLGDHWALAHIPDGPDFLFMPKFTWSADEHYLVDVASEVFELFSIGSVRLRPPPELR